MKTIKTMRFVAILVFFAMLSCAHSITFDVAEVEQGKWLDYSVKSHVGQYFASFAHSNLNKKKYWKVLYKDEKNVYFGFVTPRHIFSKKEGVESIERVARDDLKESIPFYETENLNRLLTDKINEQLKLKLPNADITSGHIILRNNTEQYQIEAVSHWWHFEGGERESHMLIIMDKDLKVLEVFYVR